MHYARYVLAIVLLALSTQANAGWLDETVDEVINKVRDVWNTVTGDVKDTAADLKRQLALLQQQGDTVKETASDVLGHLQHRRTPFLDFVNGGAGRCGEGSPCWDFRMDLEIFVLDIADLKTKFPQIERHGLGDGHVVADIIDHLPPLVLFGLYEVLQRIPNWQDTPQNLSDLFDDMGDPDAFSLEPLGKSAAKTATVASATVKASTALGQGKFGDPDTKTTLFCSQGKQLRNDPVKLNRVRAVWSGVSNMLDGLAEYTDAHVVIGLAGETSSIPTVIKGTMKTVAKVIETIFASVDAYRANLDLCKQIETDVAQRAMSVDYRTREGVKTAYWVVKGVMARGSMKNIDQTTANSLLDDAGTRYGKSTPDYVGSYVQISAAYQALFCSGIVGQGSGLVYQAFPACKAPPG
jgi:hypothetical protein